MSKIQTIICLFGFLIILFSMDLMFGSPLRETFKPINTPINDAKNTINVDTMNVPKMQGEYIIHSDDEPLHFGFS
jgi:hypothetical protein